MQQNRNKVGTSFRLSPVAIDLIAQLAEKLGLSQAGVIELSVRKLANAEGLKATEDKETTPDGE
jgi:hypothetical protein